MRVYIDSVQFFCVKQLARHNSLRSRSGQGSSIRSSSNMAIVTAVRIQSSRTLCRPRMLTEQSSGGLKAPMFRASKLTFLLKASCGPCLRP